MLAVVIAAISVHVGLAGKEKSDPDCTVQFCEHNDGRGTCKTYGPGSYSSITSSLRRKVSSVRYCHNCNFEFYTSYNFQGQRMTASNRGGCNAYFNLNNIALNGKHHPFFPTTAFANNLHSFKVRNARRRMGAEELPEGTAIGSDMFDSIDMHSPLCEAILEDGIASNWKFADSKERREMEVHSLLDVCDISYADEPEELATCKFYVLAAAAYFDDDKLVQELKFNPKMETAESEYMRCGLVVNMIHDAILEGKLSGIQFEDEEQSDYFELSQDLDFYTDGSYAISAAMSVGSVIALAVSNTLVKVCKSFASDGHYLGL